MRRLTVKSKPFRKGESVYVKFGLTQLRAKVLGNSAARGVNGKKLLRVRIDDADFFETEVDFPLEEVLRRA